MKTKTKISKILGVVLTLALLSSLVILPAPVSAATQAWSTLTTPTATGLVLDNGNQWTGPFAIAKDGSAIYAATDRLGGGFGAADLVKSTDGGRTWTYLSGLVPAYNGWSPTITDIVASSLDANTVYVTDGWDIYKTTDGGTNWAPLSNLFTSGALWPVPPSGLITSIDVGYLGTNPYIFASTSTYGGGGGAYVAQEAVWGMPWSDLLLNTDRPATWGIGNADVYVIMVDPVNFGITQMIMALASDWTNNATVITTKYGGAQWDATVNDVALPGILPGTAPLLTGSLWLPDNFSSTLSSGNMQAFAGVADMSATQGDVFLSVFAAPAGANTAAFDLNIGGGVGNTLVTGLDGIGPIGSASLLASGYTTALPGVPRVWRSTDGGFTWLVDAKRPTGGASTLWGTALSSVLVLDASTALVGTHGTGAGADNGVSRTSDFGRTWNGVSLLNTTITAIDDLELGSMFIATSGGANDAVWRRVGTTTNWERVFSGSLFATATTNFVVEASPTGDTVFVADIGGTTIWRSSDDGQTWLAQTNNITSTGLGTGTISSLVAINANTLVVGDGTNASTVYTTATNGGFWFTRTAAVGGVTSLDYDAATGHVLAGGVTGAGVAGVARSTNAANVGTMTFTAIAAAVPLGVGGADVAADVATNLIAVFCVGYAVNNTIYATGTTTPDAVLPEGSGVWSYNYSAAAPAWGRIDSVGTVASVVNGTGLVAAPAVTAEANAAMVYASDGSAAGQGVMRVRRPYTVSEQMADATSTFMGLWYEAGSNILYTIDTTAGGRIRTYTDTLNVSGSGVAVSAITGATATVSWNDLLNAATYTVVVNPVAQANFYTAVNGAGVVVVVNNAANTAAVTGLVTNTLYNVSVWGATPVSSYLFDSAATPFTTLPGVPIAPVGALLPLNGAINIPVMGPVFAWSPPAGGAISYNWQLSDNPQFLTLLGERSVAVPYLVWDEPLEYETAYYWQVQSVTAAGTSAWVTQVFTTVVELPQLDVPPQPTPTITIEIPDIVWPELPEIPDIILPPVVIPDITLPEITIPPILLPDITLPPVVIPDITIPDINIPDINIPDIVIPPLEQPDVIVNLPTPIVTQVTSTIATPPTPAYVWAIIGIGAVLSIAVIVLIVRTRRIV